MADNGRKPAPIADRDFDKGWLRGRDVGAGQTGRDETRTEAAFQAISRLRARSVLMLVAVIVVAHRMGCCVQSGTSGKGRGCGDDRRHRIGDDQHQSA